MLGRLLGQRRTEPAAVEVRPADERGFAVLAMETTGLFPTGRHRIVEIAIVALESDARPTSEWATLVNPLGDVGPADVHGIRPSEVAGAPTFAAIVGDVAEAFGGRIVVSHDLRLARAFLDAEFAAAGFGVAWPEGVSTMTLAARAGCVGRSLTAAARAAGVDGATTHRALDDAQLTAAIMRACVDLLGRGAIGAARPIPRRALPATQPSGLAAPRERRDDRQQRGLVALLDRVSIAGRAVDADPDAVLAYADLLDRILAYGRLTPDEVWDLRRLASDWGMGTLAIEEIHRAYFGGLTQAIAEAAGTVDEVSEDAREDVRSLAETLCVPRAFWARDRDPV